MVNSLKSLLPSQNKPAPEKDKKKDAVQTANSKEEQKHTAQSQPTEEKGFLELEEEDKKLLDMLYRLEEESKNPPFVLSMEESKQKKKEMDDFYLANKKSNLKMLVRAAQLRSPQQYTSKSWQNLRNQMREAMRIAGSSNASSAALTRALNHMRNGLVGLRYKDKKPEYKNLKKSLPMERIAQKPKTVKDIFGEKEPRTFEEQSNQNNVTTQQQTQAETGSNVDVSCSETSTSAAVEAAENVDVQA